MGRRKKVKEKKAWQKSKGQPTQLQSKSVHLVGKQREKRVVRWKRTFLKKSKGEFAVERWKVGC